MSRATDIARRLQLFAVSKLGITLGVLLLIYTLAGFLAAPWLLRQQLPKLIDEQLGAKATVEDVRVNPLLLKLEVQGLAIAEASGLRAFDIGLLRVNFELSSLLRWAWTFSEIHIDKPVIHADLDAKENLNLARLFAPRGETAEDKPKSDGRPPRLLIQHFAISNGAFRFTDHTLEPAARTQLDPVNFEIHDVSTLPDHDGNHRLSARLPGGGSLLWEGQLSLAPIESTAKITLSNARLATPWQFVRDHLTIAEPGGSYGLSLRYRMGHAGGKTAFSVSEMGFTLQDLLVARQDSTKPLVKLGSLALEDGSFDLDTRTLAFKNIRVADGALNITLNRDGVPDLAQLVRAPATPAQKPTANAGAIVVTEDAATPAPPWQVVLPQISIGPLALNLQDNSRVTPLQVTAAQIEATLAASLSVGKTTQATAENAALKIRDVVVRPADQQEPPVTLAEAELSGGAFDLQAQTIRAALVRLSGGRTSIIRDAQGQLQLVGMLTPLQEKPPQKSGFATTIDRIEFLNYGIALADQGFQPPLAYDLEQINLTASRLASPPKGSSPVELSLRVKQGGTLKAKGTLDLLRETADIRLELAQLALAPLDAVLKRDTTITLASGSIAASGRVQWTGKKAPGAVRYTGNAAIDALELRTAADRERLLGWKRLAVSEIDADLGENRMVIAHIGLSQPYARLLINKDKTTNLATIKRAPAVATATPATPSPATAAPAAAQPAAATPAMAVNVERVSIEGGSMDFSDLSLVLPFATFIKDLNGSASGLSSSADSRASLKLEGGIAEYGLARAEGTIQPFAPKKFTDIGVSFRNVDLLPMTPYTATFAGRRIASGKLSLDLQYKIDNSKLAGDNKLLLEKFTLGERVESPTAVSLPLDLAIALLTDSKGQIDLALPVSGDVDNPEFSYGHLIWQAIRTVLTRIVTAPFRALGALFGSNAETLGDIVFDAGGSRVLPTEQEKLRRVAEGLEKRPQLKLQVQGTWHKDVDARALRAAAVRADLAAREGTRLAPGEDAGPVGFDNAKTQRALEQMLEARAGGNAVTQFTEAYRKSSGREASRVNAALALVGRGAGDRELYVAMHQRLVELQPLPATALTDLAKARAEAINAALVKTLKFDPARLSGKAVDAVDEAAKNGVPAKLSFEPLK